MFSVAIFYRSTHPCNNFALDGKTCFWKYSDISEGTTLNICILPRSGQLITILMVWETCFSRSKCSYKWQNCQKCWDIITNFKGEFQKMLRILQILRISAKKSQVSKPYGWYLIGLSPQSLYRITEKFLMLSFEESQLLKLTLSSGI